MAQELIEIGLSRTRRNVEPDTSASLLWFVDQVLAVLPESVLSAEDLKPAQFRKELEKIRIRIPEAKDSRTTEENARTLRALCDDYGRRSRTYLTDREKGFSDLIQMLRTTLAEIAGRSDAFHHELLTSSERISRLADVQDIQQLRQQISREVQSLKQAITTKQKQDAVLQDRLSREVETLRFRLDKAKEEASLDPLTQIANRRSFDRALQRWIESQAGGAGGGFVLGMLDVDDFKRVNDQHGHVVGDRVLLCAAQWIGKCTRESDFLARYGGEEFSLLLRELKLPQAEERMTATLAKIAGSTFDYEDRKHDSPVQFTLSCGLAEFSPGDSPEDLVRRADEALYEAKRRGKNQVRIKRKSFLNSLFLAHRKP